MKKILFITILILVLQLTPAQGQEAGSLLKSSSSTIFYHASDNKIYSFPNAKIYFTWFNDFSNVAQSSNEFISSLKFGGNVLYKPGAKLVKVNNSPKVYAVAEYGVLKWIETEQIAQKLYGPNWNEKVDDISLEFWDNYAVGPSIKKSSDFNVLEKMNSFPTINSNQIIYSNLEYGQPEK